VPLFGGLARAGRGRIGGAHGLLRRGPMSSRVRARPATTAPATPVRFPGARADGPGWSAAV